MVLSLNSSGDGKWSSVRRDPVKKIIRSPFSLFYDICPFAVLLLSFLLLSFLTLLSDHHSLSPTLILIP